MVSRTRETTGQPCAPDGFTAVPILLPVDVFARLSAHAQRHDVDTAVLIGWLVERAAQQILDLDDPQES